MSKFDIMRAVVDGKMKAPPVPLDLSGKPAKAAKAKAWALSSIKIRSLEVADRKDWHGKFELKTGQV